MTTAPNIELRRYPSRKLYNKNASSYVRLPEVAEMIRSGAVIRVEDTETGEDVTRQVLLQIIMEQENQSDSAVLSADLMMDMIRMHSTKASEMMTGLFEQSVAFMRAQQEQFAAGMANMGAGLGGMGGMSSAQPWNMFDPAQMQEMQRNYQAQLASLWGGLPGSPPKSPPPANDAAEIKALKERLEELEKRMARK